MPNPNPPDSPFDSSSSAPDEPASPIEEHREQGASHQAAQTGPSDSEAPLWQPGPPPPAYYGSPMPYAGYPPQQPPWGPGYAGGVADARSQRPSGMYLAAAIINWVVLALEVLFTCGFGLIAAAWFVPMTTFIHKGASDNQKHTALGVCTLIFCNIVSGILMLVDDAGRPASQVR